ncbi:type VII secretion-associated serine protease mycosin [Mycobacterium riyadhense]|uniref:Type VII secretion-associated serine protease mycosin n=1 Tax=Mycobacterium riyadhense TaxID=486698 RepID=A0A1X2CUL3_9MYCO|nr:type VII secretion-associated serine protease mycosin [Mycobacterium riyadhense]MCV7145595.1 type VII secretion-associated serine protease mycosin [Mycobacterium riyadhense]ORW79583.1 type VII secretion-associated serine protease mycosin [Mycobacterium riyadhense]
MRIPTLARGAAILTTVAAMVAVTPVGTAAAVNPPNPDIGAAPPDGPPSPDVSMRKNGACVVGGVLPNSDLSKPPPPSVSLQLDKAHSFSTGAGVMVAIIDTGVRPQPRLPGMIPGGDYVEPAGNGFDDCDGHGTIVAGIIGAAPASSDGLIGVAPNAQILAIRQTSAAYIPDAGSANPDDPTASRTAGDIRTLARAIVHAANLGARVINVSVVSCVKATTPIEQATLGGALKYAVDVKDAVVVAAAGNINGIDAGAGQQNNCRANPDVDPAHPEDPRNWGGVTSISTPSWFDDQVLSVGFVSPDGVRAQNSMSGPWVDVAAPGSGIVSLSSTGDTVINGVPGSDGPLVPIAGSSFAAAYVSGLAALLRSRFPNLTAHQVITRIISTTHAPARGVDNVVGRGMIDPVAALTYEVPIEGKPAATVQAAQLAMPPPPRPPDRKPKHGAAIVMGTVVAVLIVVGVVVAATGARRPGRPR